MLIECDVSPGQFSTEFAVVVEAFNGRRLSFFADRSMVDVPTEPTDARSVRGKLKVQAIETDGATTLVKLPRHALETGSQFVSVHASKESSDASKG